MPTYIRSFSKINLGITIGSPRPDGFHNLTTIYQGLALHDLVTVSGRCSREIKIRITSSNSEVPLDNTNTAWKMAERVLKRMQISAEIDIHIEKKLPVRGGLGAGSANAAATLIGLERELGQSLIKEDRLRIAAEIGSDVPFFLLGGTVFGVNRGEEVRSLSDLPTLFCIVAIPPFGISTPHAFSDWDNLQQATSTTNNKSEDSANLNNPDKFAQVNHILTSAKDLGENPLFALVRSGIENDFESVIFSSHPYLSALKHSLAGSKSDKGQAVYAALSGSGSVLFGLYLTEADARVAQQRVLGFTAAESPSTAVILTTTLNHDEYWRQIIEY